MTGDMELMLMIAGMHLLGLIGAFALLLPALRGESDVPPRSDRDSDDGWGHGPPKPPAPPELPTGGLPLPDAMPARVRLRDHRRLPEMQPPRERRPAREPERVPVHQ